MDDPPAKKIKKSDGNISLVDKSILLAAQDVEKWIAERRKNWPSNKRVAEKLKQEGNGPEPKQHKTNNPQSNLQHLSHQKPMPMCKYFLKGRCNAGSNCRFSHERVEKPKLLPHERVYKRFEAPNQQSLFVKLVQADQTKEDEKFLVFLQYLSSHRKI